MKRIFSILVSILALGTASWAANTIRTVEQVTSVTTVSADEDLVITSDTPFAEGGKVDITNTEHAVVILKRIRPSKAISSWLAGRVYINGAQAVNGSNCQVRMYAEGAIILPYSTTLKPLTVYSERNFEGTAVNSFGLENTGGYMNTLTDEKLNNQIRSFRLKRGYMVTFSTREGGRGYSRCFIADQEDLEVASLPQVLDQHITSYRVFQWYNAPKKGVGSDTRADYVSLVNAAWCYDWGTGHDMLPDVECVPNHIYEDWPSSSACGSVTYSCHMKTNNEPGNSADDHPQDVATVLANWENLMRTGMRLCSESSHDGSMNHLKAFMDSIDARGWRCDVLDLHCYWPAGTFNNLTWYSDHYGNGRPIWISEWVWGASWNNNGAFAVGNRGDFYGNQDNTYNGTKPILDVLNSNPRVERYAYWNSEADCSKIYRDRELSRLGEYYAGMETGLGYNRQFEKIPTLPRQYNPSNLAVSFDKASHSVTLTWHDVNGEYNQLMEIQVKKPGSSIWNSAAVIHPHEAESDYSETIEGLDGYKYRIHITDLKGKDRYTNEATAVNDNLQFGDEVTLGESSMFLGGNQLLNGSFDFGLSDWTNGEGTSLAAPYFQSLPAGGMDGGSYLQCYGGNADKNHVQSLRKVLSLERNGSYYVSAAGCFNNPAVQRISTTNNPLLELNVRVSMPAVTTWAQQGAAFTVTSDTLLMIQFRDLQGKAQFDDVRVCRLFATREEALADALLWERERVALFKEYNTRRPDLNDGFDNLLASDADANQVEAAIAEAVQKIRALLSDDDVNTYLVNNTAISCGNFASGIGTWQTAVGTFTGGDQRVADQAGKKCWNAWWSTPAAGGAETNMTISQEFKGLTHGLYALECKAATQHYCETDQHAFLSLSGKDLCVSSDTLDLGCLDLPAFDDDAKWRLLVTPYVYISETDTVQIGFTGSKLGAVDGQFMPYGNPAGRGDNREGWWCATDFRLRQIPLMRRQMDAEGWSTICLPYLFEVPEGVRVYQLAGILQSHAAIAIEEVSAVEAGVPYVVQGEPLTEYDFYEDLSTKVTVANTNSHGLRGVFTSTSKYPLNSLVLHDGHWENVEERYAIQSYSGFIQKLSNLDEVSNSWSGMVLPTSGIEVGICELSAGPENLPDESVNLVGQRIVGGKGFRIVSGKITFVR